MKSTDFKIERETEEDEEHERTAVLAYQFWEERGCPVGSPEVDWFRAEEEIRRSKRPVRVAA